MTMFVSVARTFFCVQCLTCSKGKHNPPVIYDSNTTPERLEVQKNFTLFYEDLAAKKLPQWMFITPNMTDDGHDSSVTVAVSS
jgi:hypothetical protein